MDHAAEQESGKRHAGHLDRLAAGLQLPDCRGLMPSLPAILSKNQVENLQGDHNGNTIMAERKLYITQIDKTRLGKVIAMADGLNERDRKSLNDLAAELERAEVVPSKEVPPNVVTMNSKVVLRDMEADEKMTYTLVFPDQADINEGRISVLAPVGTAILGYTEGDVIEWPVPSGVRLLRIEQVLYQPEAAGDYHL